MSILTCIVSSLRAKLIFFFVFFFTLLLLTFTKFELCTHLPFFD